MTVPADITTVTLHDPIPYGSGTLAELKIRRPTTGDLRGVKTVLMQDADFGILQDILPRISMQPLTAQHVASISLPDGLELMAVIAGFFARRRADTQSPQTLTAH
ncbi:phage tail assembly protein [Novispirillum itersonii]|uniref:phage tail assembly protein n=1 Tax=Novispirillum itersonii TaxID=189 RepID=UPI0003638CBB|nr:phage tail assembly protein [Novispirillum itersonii]